jgi:chemotaxis signal transduction protein
VSPVTKEAGTPLQSAGATHCELLLFLVAEVDRILRVALSRVKAPPAVLRNAAHGAARGIALLDDGVMVLILDIEKVLDV